MPNCISLGQANEIVNEAHPSGAPENHKSLEETGLITDALRRVFRADVKKGVEVKGCQIESADVPIQASTIISEVKQAIHEKAHKESNDA